MLRARATGEKSCAHDMILGYVLIIHHDVWSGSTGDTRCADDQTKVAYVTVEFGAEKRGREGERGRKRERGREREREGERESKEKERERERRESGRKNKGKEVPAATAYWAAFCMRSPETEHIFKSSG